MRHSCLVLFLHLHFSLVHKSLIQADWCTQLLTTLLTSSLLLLLLSFGLAVPFRDLCVKYLVPSFWCFGKMVKTLKIWSLVEGLNPEEVGTLASPPVLSHLTWELHAPYVPTITGKTAGSVSHGMKSFLYRNCLLRPLLEHWEIYCSEEESERMEMSFPEHRDLTWTWVRLPLPLAFLPFNSICKYDF